MTSFTTFGVIDPEIRSFIDKVCDEKPIDKTRFTEWLYNEGVILFSEAQARYYGHDMKVCEEQHGHRPAVTTAYTVGLKMLGFIAVLPKLAATFTGDDSKIGAYITDQYNLLISQIVENHMPFYIVQSQIMTEMNAFLDKNPDTSREKVLSIIQEKFRNYKTSNPSLSKQIEAHILLMNEFYAYVTHHIPV